MKTYKVKAWQNRQWSVVSEHNRSKQAIQAAEAYSKSHDEVTMVSGIGWIFGPVDREFPGKGGFSVLF